VTRDPLAGFADITAPRTDAPAEGDDQAEFYPGSKRKRRAVAGPHDGWAGVPKMVLTVKGKDVTFYTVGVLAEKLERKPPAIRKWERLGYIPFPRFRTPGRTTNGQKRLYTREQIEGMVRIAREEGLIGDYNRNVSATAFPERVRKLFKELGS
jgi:hypothetical protein